MEQEREDWQQAAEGAYLSYSTDLAGGVKSPSCRARISINFDFELNFFLSSPWRGSRRGEVKTFGVSLNSSLALK